MLIDKNLFDEIMVHLFKNIFRFMRVMSNERSFIRALSIIDAIIEVCSSIPEIFGVNPFEFRSQ